MALPLREHEESRYHSGLGLLYGVEVGGPSPPEAFREPPALLHSKSKDVRSMVAAGGFLSADPLLPAGSLRQQDGFMRSPCFQKGTWLALLAELKPQGAKCQGSG